LILADMEGDRWHSTFGKCLKQSRLGKNRMTRALLWLTVAFSCARWSGRRRL